MQSVACREGVLGEVAPDIHRASSPEGVSSQRLEFTYQVIVLKDSYALVLLGHVIQELMLTITISLHATVYSVPFSMDMHSPNSL